jgi:hypothetical protein
MVEAEDDDVSREVDIEDVSDEATGYSVLHPQR